MISQYLYFIFWNIQPVIKGLWQFGSHLLTYNKNITGIYKKHIKFIIKDNSLS